MDKQKEVQKEMIAIYNQAEKLQKIWNNIDAIAQKTVDPALEKIANKIEDICMNLEDLGNEIAEEMEKKENPCSCCFGGDCKICDWPEKTPFWFGKRDALN